MTLGELARAPRGRAEVGGKAVELARLVAAGLPVPDGFVIPVGAEGARGTALVRAAAALGERLAVRSSAAIEDGAEAAAPGLFTSRIGVAPAAVEAAVEAVIESAGSAGVSAYLARFSPELARGGAAVPIAVVVQRQVGGEGSARGVLYTRAPAGSAGEASAADEVWIEATAGGEEAVSLAVLSRSDGAVRSADPDLPLAAAELAELWRLGLAAEGAIGAAGGADVEWVSESGRIWLVQARPIRAARRGADEAEIAGALAFSRGDRARTWRWAASHNPDPLSPAQAGLVDLVADLAPYEMRVVGGYLYTAPRLDGGAGAGAGAAAGAEAEAEAASDPAAIERLFREEIVPAVDRALAGVEAAAEPSLEDALVAYREVFRIYAGVLTPALAAWKAAGGGRDGDASELAAPRVPGSHPVVRALEEDDAIVGRLAPAWDVAAPSFGESGIVLAVRETFARARGPSGTGTGTGTGTGSESVGDADDMLFFRAQHAVRRALLARARRLGLDPAEDIFFVPLDQVAGAGEAPDPAVLRGIAQAARAARAAARRRAMPLAFRDGRPVSVERAASERPGDLWRGRPAGRGAARGRVLRMGDLGALGDPRGRVIVAPAVSPATVIQIVGAAALVCEHGGALDHAAALARELGLPCVVGCRGVARDLADGEEVLVDGDAGLVVRLSAPRRGPGAEPHSE